MADRGKCQICSKVSESRCSWCRLVFYCSKEHQKEDWEAHKTSCTKKKYTLETDEFVGRHLISTEDIKPDTILLKDRPLLICIKANTLQFITQGKICVGCYKEIKLEENDEESSSSEEEDEDESTSTEDDGESDCGKSQSCVKCQLPLCSPQCSSHFFHKALECRFISEAPGFSPTFPESKDGNKAQPQGNVRELILHNLIYIRALLLKHFALPNYWQEVTSLQSDEETRKGVMDELERTTKLFKTLQAIFQHVNHPLTPQVEKPDVHKLIGIIDINAWHFNISQDLELSAIYPNFSMLEHNCYPNVRFYLNPLPPQGKGGKYFLELYCRSAVKIKKGEHLSVSYVNLMWSTEKRRDFLKKERGFWCKCKRCEDPTELGSNFSTIVCMQEGCHGHSVPFAKPQASLADMCWKCTKCSKVAPPWQVKTLDSRLCEMVSRTQPSLTAYKPLLKKMEELVHTDYYLCFVLNHSLVQMYGEKDNENSSEDENVRIQNGKMLEDKIALCNRLVNLMKNLDPGLAKLNIYTAVIYYEMQSAILAMSGGEVDDDYKVLRNKPETVKLARLYLVKCVECFKYELLDVPDNKLRMLALKKMEYLDFILTKFRVKHT